MQNFTQLVYTDQEIGRVLDFLNIFNPTHIRRAILQLKYVLTSRINIDFLHLCYVIHAYENNYYILFNSEAERPAVNKLVYSFVDLKNHTFTFDPAKYVYDEEGECLKRCQQFTVVYTSTQESFLYEPCFFRPWQGLFCRKSANRVYVDDQEVFRLNSFKDSRAQKNLVNMLCHRTEVKKREAILDSLKNTLF